MLVQNALSSRVALFVVGVCVLAAGVLMLRATFRARRAYSLARRTRKRIAGKVISNKTDVDEETTLYCPVVEYTNPKTQRRATFSPAMYASGKLAEGREVAVLWDERGATPILDERPFRGGFAGNILFAILALVCAVCGVLALFAAIHG
jgi:hypothetical protein